LIDQTVMGMDSEAQASCPELILTWMTLLWNMPTHHTLLVI